MASAASRSRSPAKQAPTSKVVKASTMISTKAAPPKAIARSKKPASPAKQASPPKQTAKATSKASGLKPPQLLKKSATTSGVTKAAKADRAISPAAVTKTKKAAPKKVEPAKKPRSQSVKARAASSSARGGQKKSSSLDSSILYKAGTALCFVNQQESDDAKWDNFCIGLVS